MKYEAIRLTSGLTPASPDVMMPEVNPDPSPPVPPTPQGFFAPLSTYGRHHKVSSLGFTTKTHIILSTMKYYENAK